jgi:hypothetical protein
MQVRRRGAAVAVVLIIGLALVAGSATARERVRSAVTIGTGETASGQEFLKGKVKSPKAKCERSRRVRLFFDASGPPPAFAPVAETTTSSAGRWRIEAGAEIPPGKYYVKVRPVERGGDTCRRARSETIRVIGL